MDLDEIIKQCSGILIRSTNPSERISAIYELTKVGPDNRVLEEIIEILNNDFRGQVCVSAAVALANFSEQEKVRLKLYQIFKRVWGLYKYGGQEFSIKYLLSIAIYGRQRVFSSLTCQ